MVTRLIDTDAGRRRLQQALKDNGFDIGPSGVDGVLGEDTAKAIINARIAHKLDHQDQALVDTDLERELGLLTIQDPIVTGIAASRGIDLLSLVKLIGLATNLRKEISMDSTKPWYTSQTIWASALSIISIGLSYFHVGFSAADQATVASDVIQIIGGASGLWAIVSRVRATAKIG